MRINPVRSGAATRSLCRTLAALPLLSALAGTGTATTASAVLAFSTNPGAPTAHHHHQQQQQQQPDQQQDQQSFVYRLGNSLYVPLTSRCNSRTLPQTRGENFVLPVSVVASLGKVRCVEEQQQQGSPGDSAQAYHELQKNQREGLLPPKIKLPPPPLGPVASLPPVAAAGEEPTQRQPTVDRLVWEIQQALEESPEDASIESIVISGEGEPTLRLGDLFELARRIRSLSEAPAEPKAARRSPPAIRLTTNGLVVARRGDDSVPQLLWDSGVSSVSVALMTWEAGQYTDLMAPCVGRAPGGGDDEAFERVRAFCSAAAGVEGMEVETTAVDRPDVDKERTEALSRELGVAAPVRWRPYLP